MPRVHVGPEDRVIRLRDGRLMHELVPTHWPPALARRIPGATLNIRTGGLFMARLHYPEILGTLRRRSEG
ncbi:hypothetical protein [Rhodococcus opacus]|uniref:hypothetical protein n=1 Tax=Rhodococcus opacus TaxID=37919 RepID=UPI00269271D2